MGELQVATGYLLEALAELNPLAPNDIYIYVVPHS